jgi:hypothetical protein
MRQHRSNRFAFRWIAVVTCAALGLALGTSVGAASEAVDPEADRILRSMSTYLGGLGAFSVAADIDEEVIDLAGQKLQLSGSGAMVVQRPGHFFAHREGPVADIELIFDGRTLTLHGKRLNVFTQIEAPGTIGEAITELRAATGYSAPAGDLFDADPYPGLMTDVTSGADLGTAYVGGVECHHLAFRAAKVDWQIWIQTGDRPLPMKYVITSKWVTGAPQYAVRFRDWDTEPTIEPDRFSFSPPEGARQLSQLLVDELGALRLEEDQ